MRIEPFLESVAAAAIQSALGAEAPALLRPSKDDKHGDYQVNGVLAFAKRAKKNPRELAAPVAEALAAHEAIDKAEVAGPGFINLTLSDAWIAKQLEVSLADREREGVEPVADPETIVVDFSSPNIAKQMHVGHLRSTIIGAALVRMLRFVGHTVIGDNHIGDWGTQFGLLIVGMREFGSHEALAADPIVELERVYKLASEKGKEDEAFKESARAELAKLQSGDAENRALWERFVAATRTSLDAVYERLDVEFDEWLGESAYEERLPGVVEQLLERGIAREDQGAICVWFSELDALANKKLAKQKVPFIVRKSDGATLYSTSDIATVEYRRERWDADRALYVVDSGQGVHFAQLFEVMHQLGEDMELQHIDFGMVLGADGKRMRTRAADGTTIPLAALLDEAQARSEQMMIEELSLPPEEAARLRRPIGIGAVKYADLSQNRTSDYRFDFDKMIALDGNSGPKLQYSHARCWSILKKGEVEHTSLAGPIALAKAEELALGRRLLRFSDVVHTATEQCLPHYITDHLYGLTRDFARFFQECPVLKAEPAVRASRLALVDLSRRQMRAGLDLLGIAAPERM